MKKKVIIIILVIAALITAGFVIFGIVGYATAGKIEESYYYTYTSSGTTTEEIDVDSDVSQVIIGYNSTPMESYMEATISVSVHGLFMQGKTIENFYNVPTTTNNSNDKTIEFRIKQDQWFDPSTWFSNRKSTINLLLRTDVVYNFDIDVSVGDIDVNIPENVSVGDLELLTSTGSISAELSENTKVNSIQLITSTGDVDFSSHHTNHTNSIRLETSTGNIDSTLSNGIISGDIRSLTSTGSSTLRFYNLTYQTNCVWDFDGSTGNINIYIQQDANMNGNVSGDAATSTGDINVDYQDWSDNIGARFIGTTSTGTPDQYTSSDFASASYKYDLDLQTSTGNINIEH